MCINDVATEHYYLHSFLMAYMTKTQIKYWLTDIPMQVFWSKSAKGPTQDSLSRLRLPMPKKNVP
jgi:hypothetical protein